VKIIHCSYSIKGLSTYNNRDLRPYLKTFTREGRYPQDVHELRSWFADMLCDGIEMMPLGETCEGFSYKTGCPGHEKEPS